jgi:hypothetical protein
MTVAALLFFSHGAAALAAWSWSHRSAIRKLAEAAVEFGPHAVALLNELRAAVKAK